jgi:hypothetical protein
MRYLLRLRPDECILVLHSRVIASRQFSHQCMGSAEAFNINLTL